LNSRSFVSSCKCSRDYEGIRSVIGFSNANCRVIFWAKLLHMGLNRYVSKLRDKDLEERIFSELVRKYPDLDISVCGSTGIPPDDPDPLKIRISIFERDGSELLSERNVHPRDYSKGLIIDSTYHGVLDVIDELIKDLRQRSGWGSPV
jgi:hypothetical protein